MRLYIAEKKETALSISVALGGPAVPDGIYFDVGDERVTWLAGHLLRLRKPEEHNSEYQHWSLDYLPMKWPVSYVPLEHSREHLESVVALARDSDELVNAGEPDPEGQRLVDEVIEYAGLDKPVLRMLINDNNPAAILRASLSMQRNSEYRGMSLSALARAVCDQHYGFNLTRAYTLLARRQGYVGLLSVGRVQTPVLGLIVARDKLRAHHRPYHYQSVQAEISVQGKTLIAHYQPKSGDLVDPQRRLIDRVYADKLLAYIDGASVVISSVDIEDKQTSPPLPHSLLTLQAEAADQYHYSPRTVLEITQRLRDEYKAITYNRSDCRYLSSERHREAATVLDQLSSVFNAVENCDATRRSPAFDSSKVTTHHGIIPTANVPDLSLLSDAEQHIYTLISHAYLAQFYPLQRERITTVTFLIADHLFIAQGRVAVEQGWHELISPEQVSEGQCAIALTNYESISRFDRGILQSTRVIEQVTTAPDAYTMKTLLLDLTQVAHYVTDPGIKRLLLEKDEHKQGGEWGGIGTPGTRHGHIETLFSREYIQQLEGEVVSTAIGREFHDGLPAFAVKPDLTALWHEKQRLIESGQLDYQDLIDEVDGMIAGEIARVKSQGLEIQVNKVLCPDCQTGHLRLRQNQQGTPFWGCSAYPQCKATFSDVKGRPAVEAVTPEVSATHCCPMCQSGLIRRPAKKSGHFWWGCSDYPVCDFRAFDDHGEPRFEET